MTKIETLVARQEAHEAEGEEIRKAMEAAGIDAKQMKTIRRAKAEADAAQKTLAALLAGGCVMPTQDDPE